MVDITERDKKIKTSQYILFVLRMLRYISIFQLYVKIFN